MSLPYFPMFPSDFEAKTSHLTLAEDGAYNRLLRICWMTPGCTIPTDEAWIMRRARAFDEAEKEAIRAVLAEFFTAENGRYSNAKLTRIWREANEAHEKRKNAGSKGGKAKALKTKETAPRRATGLLKQCSSNQNQNQNHIEEDTNVSLSSPDDAPVPANDVSSAVQRYNDAAAKAGWPQVQKVSPNRSKQIRARIRDAGGLDGWGAALLKAYESDFCRGRTPKPWTGFGFDWLIKSANFTKLMEGNYDNRTGAPQLSNGREDRPDPALEQIARLARTR